MSELATKGDVEQSRQAARDLVDIMQGVLAEKIENLGVSVDAKLQSVINSVCSLQGRLDELMLTFLQGQEERHKELTRICNIINDHEKRIVELEKKDFEHINPLIY